MELAYFLQTEHIEYFVLTLFTLALFWFENVETVVGAQMYLSQDLLSVERKTFTLCI
jgi:hypothetical protein